MKTKVLVIIAAWCAAFAGVGKTYAAADTYSKLFSDTYAGKADTLTTCLISQFMNVSKGTFFAIPRDRPDRVSASTYIYWQQAHAMDVVIYAYERLLETKPSLAATYKRYMESWYKNHANNWYHDSNDPTGFLNEFTDDMCWICLTLIHMGEALEDTKYTEMAKTIFDSYVVPRGWTDDEDYWGLPWKSNDKGRNACTNAPGCLVAARLYTYTGDKSYLDIAIELYDFWTHVMSVELNNDGRVEDPPLTYTQGTFGEACRQLYHITGEQKYMAMAQKVIWYACSSGRCVDRGILRSEGESMDQSLFKAVLIPYAVNLVLDEACRSTYRTNITKFLIKNADTLWENLFIEDYPKIYCNYYWAEPIDQTKVPSMGAMASGASLIENVARMARGFNVGTGIRDVVQTASDGGAVYDLQGRLVMRDTSAIGLLQPGLYVVNGRKVNIK